MPEPGVGGPPRGAGRAAGGAEIVVLTRAPVPGRVKTRLAPLLGAEGAAALHAVLVAHALRRVAAAGLPARVMLDDAGDGGAFAGRLRRAGWRVEAQPEGDLGARMAAAMRGPGRRVAIGTDIPFFEPAWLAAAGRSPAGLVVGPTFDGGYWCIACEGPAEALWRDIPWSTPRTLAATLRAAAGLRVERLPRLRDIDEPDDLLATLADPRCPEALRAIARRHGLRSAPATPG